MMPHQPHTPPERILKHYRSGRDLNLARYYAMCEWFDETCGQLLDFLDRRKLADRTLVSFCIDNGWIQPTVAENIKGPFGGPRGKLSPYDGGIRTPVLLRWPGRTRAERYNDLVSTIDLAPTFLSACGVTIPKALTGLDLLPAASRRGHLKRNTVFGEIYTHNCNKLGHPELDVTHRWVREGDWKLIVPADGKNVELFNLARDPSEKNNLAAQESARMNRLRGVLANWVRAR
jgi:arylsulfatase A-like enzyme